MLTQPMQITRPEAALENKFLRRALQARGLADVELGSAAPNSSSSVGFAGVGADATLGTREMAIKRGLLQYPQAVRNSTAAIFRNTTSPALTAARELVKNARAEAAKRNAARVANPLRNKYLYGRGNSNGRRGESATLETTTAPPPLLVITDEIAAAAALVAEADVKTNANVTRRAATAGKGTFWMQDIARKGTVPWGDDPKYVSKASAPQARSKSPLGCHS